MRPDPATLTLCIRLRFIEFFGWAEKRAQAILHFVGCGSKAYPVPAPTMTLHQVTVGQVNVVLFPGIRLCIFPSSGPGEQPHLGEFWLPP